jgi:hypothetical protein
VKLTHIATLLSAAAPLALMVTLWVMAQISHRFGEVTHRPPLYRVFFVAIGLTVCPLVVRLLAIGLTDRQSADWGDNSLEAAIHDIPLVLAITLSVVVAWRYWGWLVYAREGQSPVSTRRPE